MHEEGQESEQTTGRWKTSPGMELLKGRVSKGEGGLKGALKNGRKEYGKEKISIDVTKLIRKGAAENEIEAQLEKGTGISKTEENI